MPRRPAPRKAAKSGTGPRRPAPKKPTADSVGRKKPAARRPARSVAASGADDEAAKNEEEKAGDRLQKVLAAAGIASRRECEELIREGRVEVDGKVVTELGTRVDRQKQEVRIDGERLPQPKLVYFAVHKPEGVVSTARDPSGRPRITDLLPPDIGRLFPVGRLDMSSEGLILLTNDGELAQLLTHPSHGVAKVYHVQVAGQPSAEVLAQLRKGMYLAEGFARMANVRIKSTRKNSTILEMVLEEGRNREIRRLLARVGHKVQRLTRIAVGPVRLGEMPPGAYRPLKPEEISSLKAAGKGTTKPPRHRKSRPNRGTAKPPAANANKAPRRVIG